MLDTQRQINTTKMRHNLLREEHWLGKLGFASIEGEADSNGGKNGTMLQHLATSLSKPASPTGMLCHTEA